VEIGAEAADAKLTDIRAYLLAHPRVFFFQRRHLLPQVLNQFVFLCHASSSFIGSSRQIYTEPLLLLRLIL
jgi:hypothetical protein